MNGWRINPAWKLASLEIYFAVLNDLRLGPPPKDLGKAGETKMPKKKGKGRKCR